MKVDHDPSQLSETTMSEATATADAPTTFNFKDAKSASIPLKLIRENTDALRDHVDREDVKYQQMVDSVRKHGIMNPISVRELVDPVSNDIMYGLVDGMHRFNAAMDAGLSEIPALVLSMKDGDLLEAQIIANVHKIETKAVQYTKALVKILASNPLLTMTELAGRLSHSPSWLTERLGLLKLNKEIQPLVDNGSLGLTNAYALAKLPPEKQTELVQTAMAKSPQEFVPQAKNLQSEIAKARREGRQPETDKFMPAARLQRLADIKDQQELASKSPADCKVIAAAKANGVSTVEDAVAYALSWALHLDPVSVSNDEAKWKKQKEDHKVEMEARAAERAAKKDAEAKAKANKLML